MNIRKIMAKAIKNQDKKISFSIQFNGAFRSQYDSVFQKRFVYPLAEEKNIDIMIQTASILNKECPNGKIVSLGQSPAWLIATASLMSDQPERYDGIAFSGAFFDEDKRTGQLKRRVSGPTTDQISAYRKYLFQNGFDPLTICNKFSKDHPFILVEHIHSGKGLVSFLSLLSDWANELGILSKLEEVFKIHFLVTPDFQFQSFVAYGFQYSIQTVPHDFMIAVANSDPFNDRLLPNYPFHKWKYNDYPVFGNKISYNAELIAVKLTYELQERNLLDANVMNTLQSKPDVSNLENKQKESSNDFRFFRKPIGEASSEYEKLVANQRISFPTQM